MYAIDEFNKASIKENKEASEEKKEEAKIIRKNKVASIKELIDRGASVGPGVE